ncbi:MAG TPA: M48 family metallopeptidase [Acidimicrobiales bacterium]|nr:M48 family metallopeptidase [Acidimicrobiales bacterium]
MGGEVRTMVGTQVARRGSAHPDVSKRVPCSNDDFFDEEELAELRAYAAPLRRVRRVKLALSFVVDLVLVFAIDLFPKVDDAVGGQPWVVRLFAVAMVSVVIDTVLGAPFGYWVDLVYEKRSGMSTMTTATWLKDLVLEIALAPVFLAVLYVPAYFAIRHFDAWWLVAGAIIVVAILILKFIAPVLILPRFNKFTPLAEGPIRARIEEIAELSGVSIEGVYLMDASKRTNRPNAGMTGFGKTKRVVVNDTICEFPMDELSQVIAHEIGHYRLAHPLKSLPLTALQMPLTLLFVAVVAGNETLLRWAGVDALRDPGSLGLFSLAMGVGGLLPSLATQWLSRKFEREADLEALELLSDPTSFVGVWPRMVLDNKANLEPTPWQRLQATHPDVAERMQFGIEWARMNDVPMTLPPRRTIPDAVASDA